MFDSNVHMNVTKEAMLNCQDFNKFGLSRKWAMKPGWARTQKWGMQKKTLVGPGYVSADVTTEFI